MVSIPTNQLNNEVTYSEYFSRVLFTKTLKIVQLDQDGLTPASRALVEVHKFLQPSSSSLRLELMNTSTVCREWHESCVIVVPSQDTARSLWKLIPIMKPGFCLNIRKRKGISVGRKRGMDSKIEESTDTYLKLYWSLHGGFIDELHPFFSTSVQEFSSLLLNGIVYRLNDSVVIQPESEVQSHSWTWKAKLKQFFVHEFQGCKQSLFKAEYYVTIPSPSFVSLALEDELTGMRLVKKVGLQQWSDHDVRPVEQILFKFIPIPVYEQHEAIYVAYELEDISPRDHLFSVGKPGCIPPFPGKWDVVLPRAENWTKSKQAFAIAVVKNVTLQKYLEDDPVSERSKRKEIAESPLDEQDYFVGDVDLEWLEALGRPTAGHPRMFKRSCVVVRRSWHNVVKLLSNFQISNTNSVGEPYCWFCDDNDSLPNHLQ